jgi:signal peptidase II
MSGFLLVTLNSERNTIVMKPKLKQTLRILFFVTLIAVNIGCDQISKDVVRQNVRDNEIINVVDDNFIITKVENTGAAMSLGENLPDEIKTILFQLMPLVVLLFLFITLIREGKISNRKIVALCFIAGGIGNIYDRIIYGSVTDFMYINLGFIKTGIFNAADFSVFVGTILIFLELMIHHKRKNNLQESSQNNHHL